MFKYQTKKKLLLFLVISSLPVLLALDKLTQNQLYHQFADQKEILNIINFNNVISNIPFVLFGLIGLRKAINQKVTSMSWYLFLIGVLLVGPGSAYYHSNPNDQTLFWDRLPMVMSFIGLSTYFLIKDLGIFYEKTFLLFFLTLGAYSLFHWITFDDLRIYYWIQLTPLIIVTYSALFFKDENIKGHYILIAANFYILAKLAETYDKKIYETLGHSGHFFKHLLAALAIWFLIQMKKTGLKHLPKGLNNT